MSQLQEAYIVAATRTPVGKAPRGVFKNTRPDDLLAFAIQGALAQVPQLDPALIDREINRVVDAYQRRDLDALGVRRKK